MGFALAIFGSVLKIEEDRIIDTAYSIRFERGVYVSDHFDRARVVRKPDMDQLMLFDGTLLAFVDPKAVEVTHYEQVGTVNGSNEKFEYINKLHFGEPNEYCVYFLTLPRDFYPKKFIVPTEPHFAARIGDEIKITWWFREELEIKLEIEKNAKKHLEFEHIDSPTFTEKHPAVLTAYHEATNLVAKVIAEKT
jgi:hypothetical protein